MKIKWTVVENRFPEMQANLSGFKGKKIQVGCKGENAWLAGIHEYGCKITVTPAMRSWLHRNGLHLKKSTRQITIPERSFLRAGFDKHHMDIIKTGEDIFPLVLDGKISAEAFLKMIGLQLETKIKEYAVDLKNPANHPFTIERKGSANPLVDSGNLVDSIKYSRE